MEPDAGKARPRFFEKNADGLCEVWDVESLWDRAKDLPVTSVRIADIESFHEVAWFSPAKRPTCIEVTRHAKRIMDADPCRPIILRSTGSVMDGLHRVARAWLDGRETIDAVRFEIDPPPDEVLKESPGEWK